MTAAGASSINSQVDLRASLVTSGSAEGTSSRHRGPRTLPPWIDSYDVRYGPPTDDELRTVNKPPPRAVPPQHNGAPGPPQRRVSIDGFVDWSNDESDPQSKPKVPLILKLKRGSERGRKWDHLRTAEPVIVSGHFSTNPTSRWRTFVDASQYGHTTHEDQAAFGGPDPEILNKLQPNFNNPVHVPRQLNPEMTRSVPAVAFYKRAWRILVRNPLVPLIFRLTVLLTSILALYLSSRIYEVEDAEGTDGTSQWTQAIVSIVVDSVAIPYIGYMTWDEYSGKPLGLRSPNQKISLVLMDLFFIIFKSASTALAFEALVNHVAADGEVRQLSRALAGFQTVGLISWSLTMAVNVFRFVQQLGGANEQSGFLKREHL